MFFSTATDNNLLWLWAIEFK